MGNFISKIFDGRKVIDITLTQEFAEAMNNDDYGHITEFLAFLQTYGASICNLRRLFERWHEDSQRQAEAVPEEDRQKAHERGHHLGEDVESELIGKLSKIDSKKFAILVSPDRAQSLKEALEIRHYDKFTELSLDQ